MITYARLPGSLDDKTLNGISEWFGMPSFVKSYWQVVKTRVNDIIAAGPKISAYQQKIAVAQYNLKQRGMFREASQLDDELRKIQDDLNKWWKVKGYIDTYWSSWVQLDSNETIVAPSGVGAVPFILAGMALTALSYVVTVGMALVQDYAYKSTLTQAMIEGKITSGQMAEVISVPKDTGVVATTIAKTVEAVGSGIGFGIPTALLVGGGLYLLYTSGVLKGILGSASAPSNT